MVSLRSVPDPKEVEPVDEDDEDVEYIGELEATAREDNHVELLKVLRNRIAATLDLEGVLPRDVAALSNRLAEVSREIERLGGEDDDDPVGDAAGAKDEDWGA